MSNKYVIVLVIGIIMVSLGVYLSIQNQPVKHQNDGGAVTELQDINSTIANTKNILKIIGIGTIITGIVEIAIAVGVKVRWNK